MDVNDLGIVFYNSVNYHNNFNFIIRTEILQVIFYVGYLGYNELNSKYISPSTTFNHPLTVNLFSPDGVTKGLATFLD